jgi:hypothetical protein
MLKGSAIAEKVPKGKITLIDGKAAMASLSREFARNSEEPAEFRTEGNLRGLLTIVPARMGAVYVISDMFIEPCGSIMFQQIRSHKTFCLYE